MLKSGRFTFSSGLMSNLFGSKIMDKQWHYNMYLERNIKSVFNPPWHWCNCFSTKITLPMGHELPKLILVNMRMIFYVNTWCLYRKRFHNWIDKSLTFLFNRVCLYRRGSDRHIHALQRPTYQILVICNFIFGWNTILGSYSKAVCYVQY